MSEKNKLTKKALEEIIYCLENGFNLTEDEINRFKKTEYVNNYLIFDEGILILLKKPIKGHRLYLYYKIQLSKEGVVTYSPT